MAIVLLFGQAMSDLSLPHYMSDIVNVGIQQNGIEHPAPDAISQDGMKLMTTLMTVSEKQLVEENYELVSGTDKNANGEINNSLYPKADTQLFVKKDVDKTINVSIDRAFGAATGTLINVLRDMESQAGKTNEGTMPTDARSIDLAQFYQLQSMLETLPESTVTAAHEKAINEETMLKQGGIMFAKAFYDELGMDIGRVQTSYIIRIGLLMLAIALFGGVATVLVSLLSSRIAAGVARNLRKDVFEKIESFSNDEFDKFSTASLITRCTNDITQIQQLLMMGIRMICYAPIMGIGGVIMAINKSASMSWIIATACIALIGMIIVILVIAMPKFKIIQKLVDKLNLVSRENLSGMMVIRAFGTQEHEKKRFGEANEDLTQTNLFVNRIMVFMMPSMMLIMNGITLLIVWVGAHQIANSTMQVGDMMAFIQYAMQIIMAFLMLSMTFILVPRAAVSAGRIAEVLETEVSIVDPENPKFFNADKKGLLSLIMFIFVIMARKKMR